MGGDRGRWDWAAVGEDGEDVDGPSGDGGDTRPPTEIRFAYDRLRAVDGDEGALLPGDALWLVVVPAEPVLVVGGDELLCCRLPSTAVAVAGGDPAVRSSASRSRGEGSSSASLSIRSDDMSNSAASSSSLA